MASSSAGYGDTGFAFRVNLSVSDAGVSVKSVRRLEMRLPAPSAPLPTGFRSGFWFDVRDSVGRVIYHFPLSFPTQQHIESFGDRPGDPMRRHAAQTLQSTIGVLVPDSAQAQSFSLHGPSVQTLSVLSVAGDRALAAQTQSSVPLVQLSVDDLRRLAQGGLPGDVS